MIKFLLRRMLTMAVTHNPGGPLIAIIAAA